MWMNLRQQTFQLVTRAYCMRVRARDFRMVQCSFRALHSRLISCSIPPFYGRKTTVRFPRYSILVLTSCTSKSSQLESSKGKSEESIIYFSDLFDESQFLAFTVIAITIAPSAVATYVTVSVNMCYKTMSRLHCESESFKMDLILDVNTWLYPMELGKFMSRLTFLHSAPIL
ncbi:DNA-directed RNA polymerases I, II, and III subunit RPABC3 [Homalodisca vitripennis]|nr:DNA-directed RNA polymerases I, II, and III subunit RPABC3 [Homalodisca vitripennis]